MSSTRVSQDVKAPRARVYRALVDAGAVTTRMVPSGMTSDVHAFDAREGGSIRISLTYDAPTGAGKTTAHADTCRGRFVKLVPDEQVVEAVEFETTDPALRGEMTIAITLADAPGGTRLELTEAGKAGHAAGHRVQSEVRRRAMRGVSGDEYATVVRVLERIVANLKGESRGSPPPRDGWPDEASTLGRTYAHSGVVDEGGRMAGRRIVGFHQDEEQHWVADLECGHAQHLRHAPPWQVRPWVTTPEGRARALGMVLDCAKCEGDTGEPPRP